MKFSKLNRSTHNWLSIIIVMPALLIFVTGILLVFKKDIDWIQPPSRKGHSIATPVLPMAEPLKQATSTPQAQNFDWHQFERIEFKPSKGIIKFVTPALWEIQIDPTTGKILSVEKRRSDLIESLHDGSFFGDFVKYFLSFPTAIILILLSFTGLYMFFLPIMKKKIRKRKAPVRQ